MVDTIKIIGQHKGLYYCPYCKKVYYLREDCSCLGDYKIYERSDKK